MVGKYLFLPNQPLKSQSTSTAVACGFAETREDQPFRLEGSYHISRNTSIAGPLETDQASDQETQPEASPQQASSTREHPAPGAGCGRDYAAPWRREGAAPGAGGGRELPLAQAAGGRETRCAMVAHGTPEMKTLHITYQQRRKIRSSSSKSEGCPGQVYHQRGLHRPPIPPRQLVRQPAQIVGG